MSDNHIRGRPVSKPLHFGGECVECALSLIGKRHRLNTVRLTFKLFTPLGVSAPLQEAFMNMFLPQYSDRLKRALCRIKGIRNFDCEEMTGDLWCPDSSVAEVQRNLMEDARSGLREVKTMMESGSESHGDDDILTVNSRSYVDQEEYAKLESMVKENMRAYMGITTAAQRHCEGPTILLFESFAWYYDAWRMKRTMLVLTFWGRYDTTLNSHLCI